jgi:transcriptional regulator with PAS, ATPase and Fis domain
MMAFYLVLLSLVFPLDPGFIIRPVLAATNSIPALCPNCSKPQHSGACDLAVQGLGGLVGQSPQMQTVFSEITKLATSDPSTTILIQGESGAGKELVARQIHQSSPRASAPFETVDCASIPETLIESELFGYTSGAFTGAAKDGKAGRIEMADHGTLFLDEIGDMPLSLQTRLLRFIQERQVHRVGSNVNRRVDIRIIAATHRDLESMVKEGKFRQDLYYRLTGFKIQLPTLRERREDIPLLANYFLHLHSQPNQKGFVHGFTSEAMDKLVRHAWRGNVRELQNAIQRAVISHTVGPEITDDEIVFADDTRRFPKGFLRHVQELESGEHPVLPKSSENHSVEPYWLSDWWQNAMSPQSESQIVTHTTVQPSQNPVEISPFWMSSWWPDLEKEAAAIKQEHRDADYENALQEDRSRRERESQFMQVWHLDESHGQKVWLTEEDLRRLYVERVCIEVGKDYKEASRILGLSRKTLYNWRKKWKAEGLWKLDDPSAESNEADASDERPGMRKDLPDSEH